MTLPPPAAPQADPAMPALPDAVTRRLRALVLASLLALAALCLAWELWLAPTGGRTLAIKALPLLLCLPGVLRHRLYTFRWLALLVWLYVMEGAVRQAEPRSAALALAEIALGILLFAACGGYVRWRLRNGKRIAAAQAAAQQAPGP